MKQEQFEQEPKLTKEIIELKKKQRENDAFQEKLQKELEELIKSKVEKLKDDTI